MEELKKLGYTENDINWIVTSIGTMKQESVLSNIKSLNSFFISLGYAQNDIIKMGKVFPKLFSYSIENIEQKIENLEGLGYSKKDIVKMCKSIPSIYGYGTENIKQKIEDMKKLGYKQEEFIKMTKESPALYSYSIENIKQKIEDLTKLGYTKEDILKMTKSTPSIYDYSTETLIQKIEDLEQLGYTPEEVIKITKNSSVIFTYNIENMNKKIEDIKKLGYSQEEVIKMTIDFPGIYDFSTENLKQKIEFYDSINLHSLATKSPKDLMQSTALSYARYMFYKDNGISIDETNYKKLFASQKSFEKQYGIKKEELLTKYDYKEYMESLRMKKDTQQLGKETMEEQKDTPFLDDIEAQQAEQQRGLKNKTQEKN